MDQNQELLIVTILVILSATILLLMNSPESSDTTPNRVVENMTDIWGAVYFPTDAYNAWQIWDEYNRSVIERDLGYAEQTNLNALRILLSYEYWRDNPEQFQQRFDHFLETADEHGIRVLPVLFESIGAEPTQENVRDDSIRTSFAVRTPSWQHMVNYNGMSSLTQHLAPRSPAGFTKRFTEHYGSDDRILAVEIMNEPGHKPLHYMFADDMLRVARGANSEAVLTMGSREIEFNARYTTPLDIYQVHHNLPPTPENMEKELQKAEEFSDQHGGKPVWLTEWQRIRTPLPEEDFPEAHPDYPQKMLPNYESLAPLLHNDTRIDGYFLWGLMVKPAYICKPRIMGRINGMFYPDGAVWDTDDVRAVAGDTTLDLRERQELPAGMIDFQENDPEQYCASHAH